MRYRLRTLFVLLAIGPPLLAYGWSLEQEYQRWLVQQAELQKQAETPRRVQLNVSFVEPGTQVTRPFDDSTEGFTIGWTSSGPTADLNLAFNQEEFVPAR
jgi:hypothetical protein